MRLSDAIRLGAMLRPQTVEDLISDEGSCAIGAALEAVGATEVRMLADMPHGWAWHLAFYRACPECGATIHAAVAGQSLDQELTTLSHLNDDHRWTREQIADWVATIEDAQQPEAQPDAVEVLAEP